MDFIIILLMILLAITVVLGIFYFIFSKTQSKKLKQKIETIDNESKLLAIDELRKILKKDANNLVARTKLANLLIENKSYLPAIKEYLIILDRFQNDPDIDEMDYYNKIGDAYFLLGNFEDAKKYYLISKNKDDYNIPANIKLGEIEMKLKNYDKAEGYFTIISKIAPDETSHLKSYAMCNYQINKFGEAADKLVKYLKINSTDNEAIHFLAHCYYNLNRNEEALKYFTKLKSIPEYAADSFLNIAFINKELKLFVQAIENFNNALMTGQFTDGSNLAEIHYQLADAYFKSHNIQKAMNHWNKVIEIDPNYKDVQTKLENYSQVSSNQLLELYLVGSVNQFTNICKFFVKYYISHFSTLKGKVKFIDIKTKQDGSLHVLTEVTSGGFIEQNFFVFMRSATTVGDMAMRNLYNTLKEQKADKGICITAGKFSESAKEFVESRMLKIIERDQLMKILNDLSKYLKKKGTEI